ncbi:MAG: hypothetical protein F6K16_29410, partial [Symploca sp. SIO2B6]|nr:hypothetical protein [Symploca sp. SIO2B6]
ISPVIAVSERTTCLVNKEAMAVIIVTPAPMVGRRGAASGEGEMPYVLFLETVYIRKIGAIAPNS